MASLAKMAANGSIIPSEALLPREAPNRANDAIGDVVQGTWGKNLQTIAITTHMAPVIQNAAGCDFKLIAILFSPQKYGYPP